MASEYNCVRGDQAVRRVEVVAGGASQSASCEVVYWKDTEQPGVRNVLWNARTDAKFCRRRAEELVQALQDGGWFCAAAESATRAAGPAVTLDWSEEKPEPGERNAPAYRAARAPEVSELRPDSNAADQSELQGAELQAIIEQNLVRLNDRVEGQFTAEIGGYGDLDGDGLEDGLALFTYEAERLARAQFIVAYLYDGESYTLAAARPVPSSDDGVHSEIETIENGVISVRLNNPEPADASCCASGAPRQRLHLRGAQLVEVKPAVTPSSSSDTAVGRSPRDTTASGVTTAGASNSGAPGCLGKFTG